MNWLEYIFDRVVRLFALLLCILFIIFLFEAGGCKGGLKENLGGGYRYALGAGDCIYGPNVSIPPYILNCNSDDRFIIAKQTLYGESPSSYYERFNFNYPTLDGIYYWIIDKKNETYYGPMTEQEYNNKSDSLGLDISFDPKIERKLNLK